MSEYHEKSLFSSKHAESRKQKQKHKPKKAQVPVHPTKVTLNSNWGFYADEPSSEEETSEHSSAPDFNQLVNASTSNVGGHFYFKDEKAAMEQAANKEESLKSSLFYIDGKLLQHALSTIPFYERQDYDQAHFTPDEIEEQEKTAAKHEETYRRLCENRGRDIIINKIRGKSAKKLPEIQKKVKIECYDATSDSARDELDDILDGTKSFSIVEPTGHRRGTTPVREAESKEHMQKWLDVLLK